MLACWISPRAYEDLTQMRILSHRMMTSTMSPFLILSLHLGCAEGSDNETFSPDKVNNTVSPIDLGRSPVPFAQERGWDLFFLSSIKHLNKMRVSII